MLFFDNHVIDSLRLEAIWSDVMIRTQIERQARRGAENLEMYLPLKLKNRSPSPLSMKLSMGYGKLVKKKKNFNRTRSN